MEIVEMESRSWWLILLFINKILEEESQAFGSIKESELLKQKKKDRSIDIKNSETARLSEWSEWWWWRCIVLTWQGKSVSEEEGCISDAVKREKEMYNSGRTFNAWHAISFN